MTEYYKAQQFNKNFPFVGYALRADKSQNCDRAFGEIF